MVACRQQEGLGPNDPQIPHPTEHCTVGNSYGATCPYTPVYIADNTTFPLILFHIYQGTEKSLSSSVSAARLAAVPATRRFIRSDNCTMCHQADSHWVPCHRHVRLDSRSALLVTCRNGTGPRGGFCAGGRPIAVVLC